MYIWFMCLCSKTFLWLDNNIKNGEKNLYSKQNIHSTYLILLPQTTTRTNSLSRFSIIKEKCLPYQEYVKYYSPYISNSYGRKHTYLTQGSRLGISVIIWIFQMYLPCGCRIEMFISSITTPKTLYQHRCCRDLSIEMFLSLFLLNF